MLTENYIKSQQIKNAYKQIYLTIPGLIILAVFIVAKFWEQNLQYTIIIWLSLMAVSIIFRLIISLNYFKSNPEDQINKKWEVYYLILIIFIGLLWSFAGVLLYHQQSIFDVAILMVILFGTATGSLVSSSYLPAITLYMPLVILPFTIRLLISFYITEDDTFLFLFFVSFFLFLMIYRVGYSFNKLYKDSFNLSSEKNDLIVNLKDIVKQKSELNKDLKQKILESKRLQELAMDSERDIKNILKNIQEVIFRSDRDGILTWVSDSVHKIFGYKPDEVIGKIYLQDFYSNPDGRDEFIRQIKKNKGIISNYVTKVKRKDNTEIWVSINSNFIYDAVQDKVLGVEGTVRDITEMRLARELQLETELKYRDIVSNVPGIVFQLELSPNGNLTFPYVSYGTMLVLGYEPEEFYKNPNLAFELMPKPDLETVMHDITTTAQSLETSKVEFRMKTKNGSYRWMDTTSTPHKKQDGSVIWDGVIIDVTARKDAEILLIESEARFKDIANNIPGMVYQFMISSDGDMSFPFISSGGIELLGYSEHDTYQNPNLPFEIVHPDDLPEVNRTITESAKNLTTWKLDFRMISKSGQTLWMRGASSPRKLDNNTVLWDGVILNITEQKETEHALKDSETRFRRFFEIGLIGMAVANHSRKLTEVNDKLCDMLGYSRQKLLKLGWDDITHPDDLKTDDEMYHEILKGSMDGYSTDKRLLKINGDILHTSFSYRCVRKQNDEVDHFVILAQDISGRKQNEEALRKYADELEKANELVEERAEKLTLLNQRLTESEDSLKKLNESKDKFFSIISHDLKSPFNPLIGFTEMCLTKFDELSPEKLKNIIERIHKSTLSLYSLLENLLQWSRLQSGRLEHHFTKFQLAPHVRENIKLLMESADAKKIRVSSDIHDDTYIYADPNMLHSILRNIITNSIKFTEESGEITISQEQSSDNVVRFSVRDTGIGMSEKDISLLFRIDKRQSKRGTFNEKGTGLGLILCKELIELHGGSISVESKPGEGSTFYIELPRDKVHTETNMQ